MKGKLWMISLVIGIVGALCFGLSFLYTYFIVPAIICSILGMILEIFDQGKSLPFFLNALVFIGIVIVCTIGAFIPVEAKLDGTWVLDETSKLELHKSGETCTWSFEEEYYKGICDYDFASNSEEEMEKTKHSYLLFMQLQEVKTEGEIVPANEFLEMENPYFKFQIQLNEEETEGTFYNPASEKTYSAKKEG